MANLKDSTLKRERYVYNLNSIYKYKYICLEA